MESKEFKIEEPHVVKHIRAVINRPDSPEAFLELSSVDFTGKRTKYSSVCIRDKAALKAIGELLAKIN